MGEQEVGHRLRRRDNVPEPCQRRLERQVAMLEPREPASRHAWRDRGVRAADPRCDLLWHPMQRMERPGAAEPAGDPSEEARPAVVRVDEVGARQLPPQAGTAARIELVAHRHGLGAHSQPAEALGRGVAGAEHVDVDSGRCDARSELSQVRNGAAALDRRDVDDLHPCSASCRCPSAQMAAARPPISQKGRKYCSERNMALTIAIVSEMRKVRTKPSSP